MLLRTHVILSVLVGLLAFSNGASASDGDVAASDDSSPESIATERPNAISFELLGRGLLYSIDYDRSLSDSIAVGVGYSSWGVDATSSDGTTYAAATIRIIPLYLNYYFYNSGGNRWFVTGGIDIISASFDFDGFRLSGTGAVFTGGVGYEYRAHNGFLIRVNPYIFGGFSAAQVWLGITLGYTF